MDITLDMMRKAFYSAVVCDALDEMSDALLRSVRERPEPLSSTGASPPTRSRHQRCTTSRDMPSPLSERATSARPPKSGKSSSPPLSLAAAIAAFTDQLELALFLTYRADLTRRPDAPDSGHVR